jgi:hypothetical protein
LSKAFVFWRINLSFFEGQSLMEVEAAVKAKKEDVDKRTG